ncbi:class I adenylate-forming enzyme family protein [Thalassococcus sp. BH17M4-6]|uniref:class I adenylate-forming enzyme family protein n=1 Tax=Thalassococcus sp. BH17M4-6 TaxID=3413148 RepID=UPI003BDFD00A
MNIALWLQRRAQVDPARPALFLGTDCIADYGAFGAAADRLAGGLAAHGIGPGDRVALFMQNVPDYLVALYGIWMAGGAAVPINAKLHPREVAWILDNAGAALCLATPVLADQLDGQGPTPVIATGSARWQQMADHAPIDRVAPRSDGDLAWLFYTSGTTGRPKGVIITHGMLRSMSLCYLADVDRVEAEDATIYAAPLSHGAGLYNFMHVQAGARHVFPRSGGFDAAEVLDLARDLGGAHLFAAPTMVKRLTDAAQARGIGGDGLRTVVYAGGPMYEADILRATQVFGPVFVQIYGQGECPMGITALCREDIADREHARWRERLASVGRAQSAVEVCITDAAGASMPEGEVGEICVRGATVMPGYWRNPDATARTLVEGWLRTGDMGAMDADGYVTLRDRSKDLIISGGSNVYPREVEEVLLGCLGVREVSVVGRADPEWGEVVVAFVVAADGVDAAALNAHCLDNIARFKRPKDYVFVPELPKNNYGKVLKTELRALLS